MNRGSTSPFRRSGTRILGFNEAPIHESGKSYSLRLAGLASYRFNEAPIHESGKFKPSFTIWSNCCWLQ